MNTEIKPGFARSEHAYLVDMISEVLKGSIGKKRGEIDSKVREIEAYGDYRMVRGFYKIMLDHCTFELKAKLNPSLMRDFAFTRINEIGYYSIKTAESVIEECARKFGISRDEAVETMWSDLPENAVLKEFLAQGDIIKEYNFRLVSSLLTKSLYIKFWVSDRWEDALWAVKRLGLMYQLENGSILVDGPTSIINNARTYGAAISKLFFFISKAKSWWIESGIIKGKSTRVLRVSSNDPIISGPGEIVFDSEVEKKFYQDFVSVNSGWQVWREPEPLKAGDYTIIPDFLLEKSGIKVYLEIVGFWTKEYLERKFRKLSELKVDNLIVAIDSTNYQGKMPNISGKVIVYRRILDAYAVYKLLKEIEIPLKSKFLEKAMRLDVNDDLKTIHELSAEHDLPEDILRDVMMKSPPADYVFDGTNLMSKDMAKRLKEKVISLGTDDAYAAIDSLNSFGIDASISTLTAIGLEIEWNGLKAKLKEDF